MASARKDDDNVDSDDNGDVGNNDENEYKGITLGSGNMLPDL